MRKKNRTKNIHEREYLDDYYDKSNGVWPKEDLQLIAIELGVTRQVVYKYLWDKKRNEKQSILKQQSSEEIPIRMRGPPSYTIKYDMGVQGLIRIPETLLQAIEFTVDPIVSVWAMEILKNNGWDLVLDNSSAMLDPRSIEQWMHILNQGEQEVKNVPEVQLMEYESPLVPAKSFDMVEQFEENYPFLKKVECDIEETPREAQRTQKKRPQFDSAAKFSPDVMSYEKKPKRHSLRLANAGGKRPRGASEDEIYDSHS